MPHSWHGDDSTPGVEDVRGKGAPPAWSAWREGLRAAMTAVLQMGEGVR
jgi:hypothetical protein